jgi:hypothetical protein
MPNSVNHMRRIMHLAPITSASTGQAMSERGYQLAPWNHIVAVHWPRKKNDVTKLDFVNDRYKVRGKIQAIDEVISNPEYRIADGDYAGLDLADGLRSVPTHPLDIPASRAVYLKNKTPTPDKDNPGALNEFTFLNYTIVWEGDVIDRHATLMNQDESVLDDPLMYFTTWRGESNFYIQQGIKRTTYDADIVQPTVGTFDAPDYGAGRVASGTLDDATFQILDATAPAVGRVRIAVNVWPQYLAISVNGSTPIVTTVPSSVPMPRVPPNGLSYFPDDGTAHIARIWGYAIVRCLWLFRSMKPLEDLPMLSTLIPLPAAGSPEWDKYGY